MFEPIKLFIDNSKYNKEEYMDLLREVISLSLQEEAREYFNKVVEIEWKIKVVKRLIRLITWKKL